MQHTLKVNETIFYGSPIQHVTIIIPTFDESISIGEIVKRNDPVFLCWQI